MNFVYGNGIIKRFFSIEYKILCVCTILQALNYINI